jgi:hypothetical protein
MEKWMNEVFKEETIPEDWPAGKGTKSLPPVVTVTQEMLAEFLQRQTQARQFEALKEHIKKALEANVPVEPGDLTATLDYRESRRLTAEHIIKELELTPEQVAELRASVKPLVSRYLQVV